MSRTDLAPTEPMSPLVPASGVIDLLRSFTVWEEGRHVTASRLPTKAEADQLRRRLSVLDAHLRPFSSAAPDNDAVQKGLAAWFLGYPSMQNADATGLVAAYKLDLKMLPAYAILRALDDIKHGRVTETDARGRSSVIGQDYPPASPRVYAQAVKVMHDHVDEQVKIRKLLSAKPAEPEMTPERRLEVGKAIQRMAADAKKKILTADAATIAMRKESDRRRREAAERSKAEFEAGALDEYAALGLEPRRIGGVIVSPELAAKLDPAVASKMK